MKTSTVLLLVGGGVAVWYFSKLAVAGQVVNVVFQGIQFKSINQILIAFNIQNVSNATITVNSMTADIYINGNDLGNASFFTGAVPVPANSQVPIIVNFQPSLLSLGGDILNLIASGSTNFDFEAKGAMNVNGLVVPFNASNQVNIPAI